VQPESDFPLLIPRYHLEGYRVADCVIIEPAEKPRNTVERSPIYRHDHISGPDRAVGKSPDAFEASSRRGRSKRDREYRHSVFAEALHQHAVRILICFDTECRPLVLPVGNQLRHYAIHRIYGHREADSRGCSGRTEDRRVDANQTTRAVQQWAARVSGVDGGVGLNEMFDEATVSGWK